MAACFKGRSVRVPNSGWSETFHEYVSGSGYVVGYITSTYAASGGLTEFKICFPRLAKTGDIAVTWPQLMGEEVWPNANATDEYVRLEPNLPQLSSGRAAAGAEHRAAILKEHARE